MVKSMKVTRTVFYTITSGQELKFDDMLRYDQAFVCDAAPGVIMFPQFKTRYGILGGRVTAARWQSFGVRMKREDFLPDVVSSGWYTFVHPKNEHGQRDYSRLEKRTLKQFQDANHIEEL